MATLFDFIDQFSERKLTDIKEELSVKDKVVSGEIRDSLRYDIISLEDEFKFIVQFFGDEGLLYVSQGRKPGTYAPVDEIKRWMELKGITPDALWPIMNKIKDQGIDPSFIFEDVFSGDSFNEFAGQLKGEMIKSIKAQLKLLFAKENIKNTFN